MFEKLTPQRRTLLGQHCPKCRMQHQGGKIWTAEKEYAIIVSNKQSGGNRTMIKNFRLMAVALSVLLILALSGCSPHNYVGFDYDLYTTAVHNVPATSRGNLETTEIIEEDSFGRTLFWYENRFVSIYGKPIHALCISQFSEGGRAYYYEDVCFIFSDENMYAPKAEIARLKELNDWEKPLNIERMSSANIVKDSLFKDERNRDNPHIDLAKAAVDLSEGFDWGCMTITSDNFGRQLLILSELKYDESYNILDRGRIFAVVVSSQNNYDINNCYAEIDSFDNYHEIVINLKKANNWGNAAAPMPVSSTDIG